METPILEPKPHWWKCRTFEATRVPQHPCPRFSTVMVPMVEVTDFDAEPHVKRVIERSQDYSHGEREGPTGFHTEYPTGRIDAHVFAPAGNAAISTTAYAPIVQVSAAAGVGVVMISAPAPSIGITAPAASAPISIVAETPTVSGGAKATPESAAITVVALNPTAHTATAFVAGEATIWLVPQGADIVLAAATAQARLAAAKANIQQKV